MGASSARRTLSVNRLVPRLFSLIARAAAKLYEATSTRTPVIPVRVSVIFIHALARARACAHPRCDHADPAIQHSCTRTSILWVAQGYCPELDESNSPTALANKVGQVDCNI